MFGFAFSPQYISSSSIYVVDIIMLSAPPLVFIMFQTPCALTALEAFYLRGSHINLFCASSSPATSSEVLRDNR